MPLSWNCRYGLTVRRRTVDRRQLNSRLAVRCRIGGGWRCLREQGTISHRLGESEDEQEMNWFIWALL